MKEVGLLPNGSMLFVEDDRDTGNDIGLTKSVVVLSYGIQLYIDKTTLLATIVAECRLEYDEYRAKTKVESKSIG
jgi:hypothetical protein